ncbi:MAG TPA: LysM peptidoglycan-binding domain-containing protein [Sphingobacteriaceae bacterium]
MGLLDFFKKGVEKPAEQKAANTPRQAQPQSSGAASGQRTVQQREYVIKPGDSLSKIVKQVYGNAADWQKIYQANRNTIKDPDLIHPGQKIILP